MMNKDDVIVVVMVVWWYKVFTQGNKCLLATLN